MEDRCDGEGGWGDKGRVKAWLALLDKRADVKQYELPNYGSSQLHTLS